MKKLIGIMTGTLCLFTSALRADEALVEEAAPAPIVEEAAVPLEAVAPIEADATTDTTEKQPTQVGKASEDGMNTSKSSTIAKYALAAGAVAIGITALILVSRHHGHHQH